MKLTIAAAAIALAATLTPAPAHAAGFNGILCHYSPDDGYDASIRVLFDNGALGYVFEGDCSPSTKDAISVYIRAGEEMWCKYDGTWRKEADAPGYHSLGFYFSDGAGCTLRTD